jgi:predicted transcriptional regulator
MSSGRKSSVTRLRELAEPRCRAALVCFLWQSYRDAVDQTVDMFDKLLTRASTQAQNELDEQLRRQRQTIQVSLTTLRSLGRIILDDAISDEELRAPSSLPWFRARSWWPAWTRSASG